MLPATRSTAASAAALLPFSAPEQYEYEPEHEQVQAGGGLTFSGLSRSPASAISRSSPPRRAPLQQTASRPTAAAAAGNARRVGPHSPISPFRHGRLRASSWLRSPAVAPAPPPAQEADGGLFAEWLASQDGQASQAPGGGEPPDLALAWPAASELLARSFGPGTAHPSGTAASRASELLPPVTSDQLHRLSVSKIIQEVREARRLRQEGGGTSTAASEHKERITSPKPAKHRRRRPTAATAAQAEPIKSARPLYQHRRVSIPSTRRISAGTAAASTTTLARSSEQRKLRPASVAASVTTADHTRKAAAASSAVHAAEPMELLSSLLSSLGVNPAHLVSLSSRELSTIVDAVRRADVGAVRRDELDAQIDDHKPHKAAGSPTPAQLLPAAAIESLLLHLGGAGRVPPPLPDGAHIHSPQQTPMLTKAEAEFARIDRLREIAAAQARARQLAQVARSNNATASRRAKARAAVAADTKKVDTTTASAAAATQKADASTASAANTATRSADSSSAPNIHSLTPAEFILHASGCTRPSQPYTLERLRARVVVRPQEEWARISEQIAAARAGRMEESAAPTATAASAASASAASAAASSAGLAKLSNSSSSLAFVLHGEALSMLLAPLPPAEARAAENSDENSSRSPSSRSPSPSRSRTRPRLAALAARHALFLRALGFQRSWLARKLKQGAEARVVVWRSPTADSAGVEDKRLDWSAVFASLLPSALRAAEPGATPAEKGGLSLLQRALNAMRPAVQHEHLLRRRRLQTLARTLLSEGRMEAYAAHAELDEAASLPSAAECSPLALARRMADAARSVEAEHALKQQRKEAGKGKEKGGRSPRPSSAHSPSASTTSSSSSSSLPLSALLPSLPLPLVQGMLYHHLHVTHLFAGDGWTRAEDESEEEEKKEEDEQAKHSSALRSRSRHRGLRVRELLAPSVPLAYLPAVHTLPLLLPSLETETRESDESAMLQTDPLDLTSPAARARAVLSAERSLSRDLRTARAKVDSGPLFPRRRGRSVSRSSVTRVVRNEVGEPRSGRGTGSARASSSARPTSSVALSGARSRAKVRARSAPRGAEKVRSAAAATSGADAATGATGAASASAAAPSCAASTARADPMASALSRARVAARSVRKARELFLAQQDPAQAAAAFAQRVREMKRSHARKGGLPSRPFAAPAPPQAEPDAKQPTGAELVASQRSARAAKAAADRRRETERVKRVKANLKRLHLFCRGVDVDREEEEAKPHRVKDKKEEEKEEEKEHKDSTSSSTSAEGKRLLSVSMPSSSREPSRSRSRGRTAIRRNADGTLRLGSSAAAGVDPDSAALDDHFEGLMLHFESEGEAEFVEHALAEVRAERERRQQQQQQQQWRLPPRSQVHAGRSSAAAEEKQAEPLPPPHAALPLHVAPHTVPEATDAAHGLAGSDADAGESSQLGVGGTTASAQPSASASASARADAACLSSSSRLPTDPQAASLMLLAQKLSRRFDHLLSSQLSPGSAEEAKRAAAVDDARLTDGSAPGTSATAGAAAAAAPKLEAVHSLPPSSLVVPEPSLSGPSSAEGEYQRLQPAAVADLPRAVATAAAAGVASRSVAISTSDDAAAESELLLLDHHSPRAAEFVSALPAPSLSRREAKMVLTLPLPGGASAPTGDRAYDLASRQFHDIQQRILAERQRFAELIQ